MTEDERKIAKLSKTLNNSILYTHSNYQTDEEAYQNTIHILKNSLQIEKNQSKEDQNKYLLSVEAKLTEETLKKLAQKHHSKVLQAQIKEKQLKKKILNESLSPTIYPPKQDYKPVKNYQLREELYQQIINNEKKKKNQIADDLLYGKKIIEESNRTLEEEIQKRNEAKESTFKSMIES